MSLTPPFGDDEYWAAAAAAGGGGGGGGDGSGSSSSSSSILFYVTTAVCHIPSLLPCECSRLDEWAALLISEPTGRHSIVDKMMRL